MKNSQGILTQVPTEDAEIRELLKGKTAVEKRHLLKEIEKAKQAKIHMCYLMEQQKLKNDQRWAVRNVEERQAILSLYDNTTKAASDQSKNDKVNQVFPEERHKKNDSESGLINDNTGLPSINPPVINGMGFDEEDPTMHTPVKVK